MKILFKLFASLTDYLPADRRGNVVSLPITEGTTVQQVIVDHCIPQSSAHLVLVNGVYIPPPERARYYLSEGDELAIWPPIAGG